MGTEVLRPQDCLSERIRVSPSVFQQHRRPKNLGNGNGGGTPNPRVNTRKTSIPSDQKKRNGQSEPLVAIRTASLNDLRKSHHGNLVMGQVTILSRGESLDPSINVAKMISDDLVLCGTERLGPDLEHIRIRDLKSVILSAPSEYGERLDGYAGSAVSVSPSPRALPLPSFFSKKKSVDDSATRDLRRLLQLD